MTYFPLPLRFYPPLKEAELPELHESVCRGWGADDPHVIEVCVLLIRAKKIHEAVLAAMAAAGKRQL